ncbi:ATP-binding protein [Streptomyces pseudogriseolus]|uniref:ATP-binding protein n=1 Tax=Streptomyces pseudogriseolus TaxID=36817 RepID=UPI003FA0CDA0
MNGSIALQSSPSASAAGQLCPATPATKESSNGSAQRTDSALASRQGTMAQSNARAFREDAMVSTFEIAQRGPGEAPPERDTRRVAAMRRLTAARLRYCGLEPLVDDAKLIVSELVTNVIQHGNGAQVTFTMTVRGGFLRLAVNDETPGRPVVRHADDDAEHGRGLFLVDCLAAAHGGTWGTSDDGTTTWCCLAVPGGRP